MRTKTFLFSLLILALALSACLPGTKTAEKEENIRTLNVNGSAQLSLAPDIAYISVGVHTENPNASEAVAQNNAQAQKIIEALKAKGVDEKDVATTNFSISPQDEWGPDGQRTGTRYIVDNTVYVTLRDIAKIGDIIGAAVDAGANSIYGIQFDVADKTSKLTEARKAAVENARLQAEELAAAAGVTLGPIQSINYYNSYPVTVMDSKVARVEGYGGGVPISPGQLTVTVDVNITFEIR